MKLPLRHIVDHLVWSTSGTVWAVWSLTPAGSRYMPDRTREQITAQVTALVRSLPGSARMLGLCARIDAGEVVAGTLDGVDYRRHEAWAEVAEGAAAAAGGRGPSRAGGHAPAHCVAGRPASRARWQGAVAGDGRDGVVGARGAAGAAAGAGEGPRGR